MTLGRHSYCAGVDHAGDTRIGHFTAIARGVTFEGADNHACIKNPKLVASFDLGSVFGKDAYPDGGFSKGSIVIGSDVWIGENAQILTGVTISDGAIIAAHSVVTKDVPPYALIAGNPGEIKRFRFTQDVIQKLLRICWWEKEDGQITEMLPLMQDIDTFIQTYG